METQLVAASCVRLVACPLLLLLTHLSEAFVTAQMVVMVMLAPPTMATLGSAPGAGLV